MVVKNLRDRLQGRRTGYQSHPEGQKPPGPTAAFDEATLLIPSNREDSDRFVISLSTPDSPNILKRTLEVLDDGVSIGTARPLCVEASLSASLSEIGFISVVVRVDEGEQQSAPEAERVRFEAMRSELEAGVESTLKDLEPDTRVEVDHVRKPVNPILNRNRVLREMRFGLRATGPEGFQDLPLDTYFKVLHCCAEELANEGLPVLFAHVPHRWRGLDEQASDILRVGFSCGEMDPASFVAQERIRARLHLMSTSMNSLNIDMFVYDATKADRPFSHRFLELGEGVGAPYLSDDPVGSASADDADEPLPTSRTCIIMRDPGRVGLLADFLTMISNAVNERDRNETGTPYSCDGATMAVVDGWTVVMAVVSGPTTDELASAVFEASTQDWSLSSDDGRDQPWYFKTSRGGSLRFIPTKSQVAIKRGSDTILSLWVCWRAGDSAGQILSIIDVVTKTFVEAGWPEPNIEYAVSRVLHGEGSSDETCAGKIRLTCPRPEASLSELDLIQRIKARAVDGLSISLEGWKPEFPEWRDRPVEVSTREPDEGPWGFLASQISV